MFNRKTSLIQVGLGTCYGVTPLVLLGRNGTADTATFEPVWPHTAVYTPNAAGTAESMTLSSGDGNDLAVTGSGARTARVTGILASGLETSEEVNLNGQTGVTLTNSYVAINNIEVLTAGTGRTNAGNLYVGTGSLTAGVPLSPHYSCPAGWSQKGSALYTVPKNKTLLIHRIYIGPRGTSTVSCEATVTTHEGNVFMHQYVESSGSGTGSIDSQLDIPIKITSQQHLQVRCVVSTAVVVVAALTCLLIDNDSGVLSV